MSAWYIYLGEKQHGPLSVQDAQLFAAKAPNAFAWTEGFPDWKRVTDVKELALQDSLRPSPPACPPVTPKALRYKIHGSEMQFVEITLDPEQIVFSEPGSLMYKDPSVRIETALSGDGDESAGGGLLSSLISAGKRVVTEENLFSLRFRNTSEEPARVAFAAPHPGNIVAVTLADRNTSLICQKNSFLCASSGTSLGMYLQANVLAGLIGGEGFIMQKIEGRGLVFVHAGGTVIERELADEQELHIDTGCIVGFESSVRLDVVPVGGVVSTLFAGEGLVLSRLKGPGRIWLQSLPLSRIARRLAAAADSGNKEEGSILGGFGRLLQGDK